MTTRAIVAMDPTGIIAVDGKIPWHYPADMRHFKARTMGGVCVMGRKTFETLPVFRCAEILPGRVVIALSHEACLGSTWRRMPDAMCSGVEDALRTARKYWPERDVWICGGADTYSAADAAVDEVFVTWVPKVDAPRTSKTTMWWPYALPYVTVEVEQPEGFAEAGLRLEKLVRPK